MPQLACCGFRNFQPNMDVTLNVPPYGSGITTLIYRQVPGQISGFFIGVVRRPCPMYLALQCNPYTATWTLYIVRWGFGRPYLTKTNLTPTPPCDNSDPSHGFNFNGNVRVPIGMQPGILAQIQINEQVT
jgi:hypothetical protein